MKKIVIAFMSLGITLGLVTASWSINFGDILNDTLKQPPKEEPAPKPAPAKEAPATNSQSGGGGGLIGILEGTGAVDKKTSNILRGAGNLVKSLQPIGWEEERAIGGSLALEVFSRFGGQYKNEKLQRYISLVGLSVAGVSDRADIPYHFAILNSDTPNAFAAPGGYIFVSSGLLRLVRNEAELAGVLGHEVAHVAKRHALKTIERSKTLQGFSQLTTSILDSDPGVLENIVKEMSETLFTKGLDQGLEFEADKFGMEYAYRVGYFPGGLRDFMKVLNKAQGSGSALFSTHPTPRARYGKLNVQFGHYADASKAPTLAKRYSSNTQGQL
ncbi:MAG: M48 family metalloprotease [Nitrospina sp.]|nr:M48 family metalloprotease [Nitrospina sp.]